MPHGQPRPHARNAAAFDGFASVLAHEQVAQRRRAEGCRVGWQESAARCGLHAAVRLHHAAPRLCGTYWPTGFCHHVRPSAAGKGRPPCGRISSMGPSRSGDASAPGPPASHPRAQRVVITAPPPRTSPPPSTDGRRDLAGPGNCAVGGLLGQTRSSGKCAGIVPHVAGAFTKDVGRAAGQPAPQAFVGARFADSQKMPSLRSLLHRERVGGAGIAPALSHAYSRNTARMFLALDLMAVHRAVELRKLLLHVDGQLNPGRQPQPCGSSWSPRGPCASARRRTDLDGHRR